MNNLIPKFITFVTVFVYGISAFGQSIVVHTSDYKQTIDMIGGDMERSSKAIQSAQNKQQIIEWSFKDINFNVCRVQYDKNQELVEGTKNWGFYDKQVATMQAIKEVNPDIKFFATMRSDYDGYGDENNLPDWIVNYKTRVLQTDKYAIFLADYLEYMSKKGVPISIMSTSKEWMWHVRAEKVKDLIPKLYNELDARGIEKPLISDQGFWSISQGITYLNNVEDLGTKDLYHSFCSHNYANEDAEKWVEIIEKSNALGKPMYDDETSTGSGSPTYGEERAMYKQIGEYIKKATRYKAGLSGEIFFEIWSRGIDKETRSIYFPGGGTGTRLRGYYLMKHFSNNILDSRYVPSSIASMPNVYTISFRKDNQVVLWVINKSTTAYSRFPIGVDAFEIDGAVNVTYWTDNTPISGSEMTHAAMGNMFETGIAGEGINCYIFNVKDEATNLSLSATATQSSTAQEGTAQRAIDGTMDGAFEDGSVTLTNEEENPWWQLDLGANDTIGVINIYNRTDECCRSELSNFTVTVMDASDAISFTQTYAEAPDPSVSIDAGGVIGKTIKIQINGTATLSLAEVEVLKGSIFKKFDQSIHFPSISTISYRKDPIDLGVSSSSGLGVSYTSSNTSVASFVDGKLQLNGVGTTTITVSAPASALYNAAEDVSREITITKAYQQITFAELPVKKEGDLSFLANAVASSGLDIEYASSDPLVASIEEGRIVIVGEGVCFITAMQAGNEVYHSAELSRELTVEKSEGGNVDPTTLVLSPIHDAYVRGGDSAGENYGSDPELLIKETSNSSFKRLSLIMFDVFDVDQLDKATLRLYANSAKASQIVVYATSDNWSEKNVNYSNAPHAGLKLDTKEVVSSGIYYEWDVTEFVKSQLTTDDIASFLIADISSNKNNIGFNSKEATDNLPQLLISKQGTATNMVNSNPLFSLFPNPANDFVNISADNGIKEITVTDSFGLGVLNMKAEGEKQLKIQLDGFLKGLYLVQVMDLKGNKSTLKFVMR